MDQCECSLYTIEVNGKIRIFGSIYDEFSGCTAVCFAPTLALLANAFATTQIIS